MTANSDPTFCPIMISNYVKQAHAAAHEEQEPQQRKGRSTYPHASDVCYQYLAMVYQKVFKIEQEKHTNNKSTTFHLFERLCSPSSAVTPLFRQCYLNLVAQALQETTRGQLVFMDFVRLVRVAVLGGGLSSRVIFLQVCSY